MKADRERDAQADLEHFVQQLLGAQRRSEADEAAQLLGLQGPAAIEAVARRARQLSSSAQRAAIEMACQVKGMAALELLAQLLEYGARKHEERVIRAIGQVGERDGVRVLLEWLGGSADDDQLEVILDALEMVVGEHPEARWEAELGEISEPELKEVQLALDEAARPGLGGLSEAVDFEADRRKLRDYGTLIGPETEGLERAFRRERVVEAVFERLWEAGNRSLVLVGASGVGKTTLLQEVCRRLGRGAPADLMLQTSSGLLMAGTRWLGEWQTRIRDLVVVLRRRSRILLYVSDINHLIGAGTTVHSQENIADFLAPYIRRGELTVIGESTAEEMRRGLDLRPAFKRLFRLVQVEEALPKQTHEIIVEVSQALAQQADRHGVTLSCSATFPERLIEIADQFRASAARPGRAIDLLRQTVERVVRPPDARRAQAGAGASEAGVRERAHVALEPHHIIETLVHATGIPKTLLDDREPLKLDAVRDFFNERVLGQEEACEAVVDLITLVKSGLTDPTKPMGVLFFVGPTGVGKTELAKAMAEYLFGSADRMIRLDMSEYMDFSSMERLIGSPHAPEWSPHRQGQLTGRIREEPFSVVLLDEAEKAHKAIFDLLLQVMDDGRLTDAAGRVAHFTQAIIIMTSNLGGAELFQRGMGFAPQARTQNAEPMRREMENHFRPEFINRIDRIVPFRPLAREDIQRIVRREIGRVLMRSGIKRRGITVDYVHDPRVVDLLAEQGFDPRYGARPLKRVVERRLLLPLGRTIVRLGTRAEQALLRLFAEDEVVRVEVIRSEPSPTPEVSAPEESPGRDRRRMLEEQAALEAQVSALEAASEREGLESKKSLLLQLCGQPAFWDDAERALQVQSEIHWIERFFTALARVRKRTDDLGSLLQVEGARADERLARAIERHDSIHAEVSLLELAIASLDRRESRADAFVCVERLDHLEAFGLDPAASLVGMYASWARRHGFAVDVLDERVEEDGQVRSATLLIHQGLCAHGVLGVEAGIHRLIERDPEARRERGRREKATAYCRVDVFAFIEGAQPRLERGELEAHVDALDAPSVLGERLRARVTLRHRASDTELELTSELAPDEALALGTEYLRARLHVRDRLEPSPTPEEGGVPVRTYNFGVRSSARDDLTGVKVSRVEAVLEGDLEPFLRARLLPGPSA